jgi:formamidopyrimidine-DNA glycosylase
MPELPEVETIVRSLRPCILGKKISSIKVFLPKIIRWPGNETHAHEGLTAEHHEGLAAEYEELIGKTLINIYRLGKNIILQFSLGRYARIHLKMTGQLLVNLPSDPLKKHTHVIFSLDGGQSLDKEKSMDGGQSLNGEKSLDGEKLELRYRDIRQFGYIQIMTEQELAALIEGNSIGPDPLKISFPCFLARLRSKRGKLKAVLLDQAFLAGLGNIYVDETLYQAGIHPESSPLRLSDEEILSLHQKMQSILLSAIQHKGSSIRDYVESSGEQGHYQDLHRVYGKAGHPCLRCGTGIEKIRVAGRGTYLCPRCQRVKR